MHGTAHRPIVTPISRNDPSLADAFHAPVVIVGAGACGLTAALRLGDQKITPLILERDSLAQGSTALSSGFIPAPGTAVQRAAGIADSPALFARDILHKSSQQADPALTRAYAQAIGPAIDWLQTHHNIPFELLDGFLYPGHSVRRMHAVPEHTGEGLINRLSRAVERAGISIMNNARVFELLVSDRDHPVGVRFSRPDQSTETVTFDFLLLACNGYGGNPELVSHWLPELRQALYAGHAGNDGSAVIWGQELGAELADMGAYQGHGSWATPHGILISWALMMRGGVQINQHGDRFHNETLGYSEAAVQVIAQPAQKVWNVFSQSELAFARDFPDFQQAEKAGAIRTAQTTSELAALIGCPVKALHSTLDAIETATRTGRADQFDRHFEQTLTAPFAAVQVTGALFHTQGGLATTTSMQMRRLDGSVFDNCYAAGGAARGVSGQTVAGYLSGNGLLSAIAGGSLAAEAIGRKLAEH